MYRDTAKQLSLYGATLPLAAPGVKVEKPKFIWMTTQRNKLVVQGKINQETKHIEIPQTQRTEGGQRPRGDAEAGAFVSDTTPTNRS